jgi:hypothetical protein
MGALMSDLRRGPLVDAFQMDMAEFIVNKRFESTLHVLLDRLPGSSRAAFAISCAETGYPYLHHFLDGRLPDKDRLVRQTLDGLWDRVLVGESAQDLADAFPKSFDLFRAADDYIDGEEIAFFAVLAIHSALYVCPEGPIANVIGAAEDATNMISKAIEKLQRDGKTVVMYDGPTGHCSQLMWMSRQSLMVSELIRQQNAIDILQKCQTLTMNEVNMLRRQ